MDPLATQACLHTTAISARPTAIREYNKLKTIQRDWRNMASNRIVDKVVLATIQKASQRFVLEAATETQTFKRSEAQINAAKPRIIGIVQNSGKVLPTNTAKAVVR